MIQAKNEYDVSVIICTYNRWELLSHALKHLCAQDTCNVRYEIVVVDNNSTDETRKIVESFIARHKVSIRYVFENKQGLSHARNAGIKNALAPLLAFTDDDVEVAPDWIKSVKESFDKHPEVDFVGGKVLPNWPEEPPAWLTSRSHWAPVALTDYGDASFYSNAENPVCLIGANIGIRRSAFNLVGMYEPKFQRMKGNIGAEDHEWLLRLWQAGGQGIYVPTVIVKADVPVERMKKAFHRIWHTGHGYACGLMQLNELIDDKGELRQQPIKARQFLGASAFLYRDLLASIAGWFKSMLRGNKSSAFAEENQVRYLISYIRNSRQYNLQNRYLRPTKTVSSPGVLRARRRQ